MPRNTDVRPAETETTTYEDDGFRRTALVLKGPECGSIDVVRRVDGKLVRLCQINLFDYPDKDDLIVDVIDVDNRYTGRRALIFEPLSARPRTEIETTGNLVSVDFKKK